MNNYYLDFMCAECSDTMTLTVEHGNADDIIILLNSLDNTKCPKCGICAPLNWIFADAAIEQDDNPECASSASTRAEDTFESLAEEFFGPDNSCANCKWMRRMKRAGENDQQEGYLCTDERSEFVEWITDSDPNDIVCTSHVRREKE